MNNFNSFSDDFYYYSNELNENKIKFETMMEKNEFSFMDSDKLEELYHFYKIHSKEDYCNELLNFALEIHPYNPIFYELRFNQYFFLNQFDKALLWIEYTLNIFPNHNHFLKLKADVLRKLENYVDSINLYWELLETTDDKSLIYFHLASCYYEFKNFDTSIPYWLLAYQENNKDTNYLIFNYILLHLECEQGIYLINKFLDYNPFDAETWYHLSQIYHSNENYEEALKAIDYAIFLETNSLDYYTQKIEILKSLKRYEEALKYLFEALQIEPDNLDILYNIGLCYLSLKFYDDARRYFKKCIDIDETYYEAYECLADCLFELERYHESLHYYKVYLDNVINLEACIKYIDLLIELDNFQEATDYIKQIENILVDDYLEGELLLRSTYIEFLKGNTQIYNILRDNFYLEFPYEELKARLRYQAAALSFALGARTIGFFYLENALLTSPTNYEYLYDYNPDLKNDEEIQILIEINKKN
jgi:tetratricopeptide (TPR) repeat protein